MKSGGLFLGSAVRALQVRETPNPESLQLWNRLGGAAVFAMYSS